MRNIILFTFLAIILASTSTLTFASQATTETIPPFKPTQTNTQSDADSLMSTMKDLDSDKNIDGHAQTVLACANYYLKTPADTDDNQDITYAASKYIISQWALKTDKANIKLTSTHAILMNNKADGATLLLAYFAAVARYALSIKPNKEVTKERFVYCMTQCVEYYEANQKVMEKNKEISKWLKDMHKGTLQETLSKRYDNEIAKDK